MTDNKPIKPEIKTHFRPSFLRSKEEREKSNIEQLTKSDSNIYIPSVQELKDEVLKKKRSPEEVFARLKKAEKKITQQVGLPNVEYEEHNPRFMKSLPRFELKYKDHSGIIIAKACLRKYFYSEILNLIPKDKVNIYFPWGSAYHIFRQRLSELYGFGENEPRQFDEGKAKKAFAKANIEGLKYWMQHGKDQKPDSKLDWFTVDRLNKSFLIAFRYWADERKKNQVKVLEVEQYFNLKLKDGNYIQGRIDEFILKMDKFWVRDFKTTSKPEVWYEKTLQPNNQIKTYTWGGSELSKKRASGGVLQVLFNGKSTKKEEKGPDVFEKIADITEYELEQWEDEQVHWNSILADCREKDSWPMSEVGCAWCEYQKVCIKGTEASQVYQIEQNFTRRLRNPQNVFDEDE